MLSLKLGISGCGAEEQLLKLDQQILTHRHKIGVVYCRPGQSTEEDMYSNEEGGPAFDEFLDLIGQRVPLKGFDKYTGGLDTKGNNLQVLHFTPSYLKWFGTLYYPFVLVLILTAV